MRKRKSCSGFTIIETLIAITVLSVGLIAMAALISKMDVNTHNSRYMSSVTLLASEKLENLSRLNIGDPALDPGGSVTADVDGYNDQVLISVSDGLLQESIAGDIDPASGKPQTGVYTQGPDGVPHADMPSQGNAVPTITHPAIFKRRWMIEDNPTGLPAGCKRMTVQVTAPATGAAKPATFQISTVRYGN